MDDDPRAGLRLLLDLERHADAGRQDRAEDADALDAPDALLARLGRARGRDSLRDDRAETVGRSTSRTRNCVVTGERQHRDREVAVRRR